MNIRNLAVSAVLFALALVSSSATALTMNQFASICESTNTACSEHPILQAYVGGALDLVAMLDEETDYLAEVYCKPAKELFDVPAIIRYMETQQAQYLNKNAMLVVIRYLEEQGGCLRKGEVDELASRCAAHSPFTLTFISIPSAQRF